MGSAKDKLEELEATLEAEGEDPLRVETVRRARRFKASWLEMAEILVEVRRTDSFRRWGYEDFFTYSADELLLKRATVEKLTMSYGVLERHAPEMLHRAANDTRPVPTCDAVEYFARALRESEPPPGEDPPAVLDELKHAVFDEGRGVASLRRKFDPILRPSTKHDQLLDTLERTSSWVRKLRGMLDEVAGLPQETIDEAQRALDALKVAIEESREEENRAITRTVPKVRASA